MANRACWQAVLIFPYKCDAPIYHYPWGTIGLIVVNVLVFVCWSGGLIGESTYDEHFVLWHEGLYVHQWLTSLFAHADLMHLLGNMVFLWCFGLIVEGKLGWRVFLPLYLIIGLIPNAVEQLLMWAAGSESGSLGASTAIYGLMTVALFWAPRNVMDVFVWFIIPRSFEAPVWGVVLFYVGWDLFFAFWSGWAFSTPVLHLNGVFVALPVAWWMLKKERVDGEGWDLLTWVGQWRGNREGGTHTAFTASGVAHAAAAARNERQVNAQLEVEAALGLERYEDAWDKLQRAEFALGPLPLAEADLRALLTWLERQGRDLAAAQIRHRLEQLSTAG